MHLQHCSCEAEVAAELQWRKSSAAFERERWKWSRARVAKSRARAAKVKVKQGQLARKNHQRVRSIERMVQLTNSSVQLQMNKVQRCQHRFFRCNSISQHLPLSVSEWVIDSFRFGDSYRISELCEIPDLKPSTCSRCALRSNFQEFFFPTCFPFLLLFGKIYFHSRSWNFGNYFHSHSQCFGHGIHFRSHSSNPKCHSHFTFDLQRL